MEGPVFKTLAYRRLILNKEKHRISSNNAARMMKRYQTAPAWRDGIAALWHIAQIEENIMQSIEALHLHKNENNCKWEFACVAARSRSCLWMRAWIVAKAYKWRAYAQRSVLLEAISHPCRLNPRYWYSCAMWRGGGSSNFENIRQRSDGQRIGSEDGISRSHRRKS